MANIPEQFLQSRLHEPIVSSIREMKLDELQQKVKVEQVPMPKPRSGQVLIKVEKASINPADLSTLKGTYGNNRDLPCTLGLEGCGTVVQNGGGFFGWRLVGKRVAFSASPKPGAWGEYVVAPAMRCIELTDDIPWEAATSCFVNPMTVLAFVEIAESLGEKTILHTAAASTLGKMLIRHAKRRGIEIICVVRREEQAKICRDCGAQYVVDSSEQDFISKLQEICKNTKCKIAFDAVGGNLTGDILYCMNDSSTVYVYGGLSEERPIVSTRDLIFKKKTLSGFWLTDYIKTKYSLGMYQWVRRLVPLLTTDFAVDIAKTVPLKDIHQALQQYATNMSQGKIILHCNSDTWNPSLA